MPGLVYSFASRRYPGVSARFLASFATSSRTRSSHCGCNPSPLAELLLVRRFTRAVRAAFLSLFITLVLTFESSFANITEEGFGIVYGADHAFSLKAPKGWMLDNESGVNQGVHAVFYPKGSSWKDSVVVAYARARAKTDKIVTADDAAKFVVEDFHANGSPNYQGKRIKTIKCDSGNEAVIYYFSGDQWGNSEAVAYYVETRTINFVTLTSRDRDAFENALPAFEQLAASYTFMGDGPLQSDVLPAEPFDDLRARAIKMGDTEEGKAYEKHFSEAFAQPMRAALQTCTKSSKPPYTLNLVFVIGADGNRAARPFRTRATGVTVRCE